MLLLHQQSFFGVQTRWECIILVVSEVHRKLTLVVQNDRTCFFHWESQTSNTFKQRWFCYLVLNVEQSNLSHGRIMNPPSPQLTFSHIDVISSAIRGELISLWLYKENNKLQDWKNIFTLHIPPWAPHTYDLVVLTSITYPRKILLVALQTIHRWNRKSQTLISISMYNIHTYMLRGLLIWKVNLT
jgi:hypothetical protein